MIKTFEAFDDKKYQLLEFIKNLPKKYITDYIEDHKLAEVAKETSKKLGIKIHQDYIIDLPYTASTLEGIVHAIKSQKSLVDRYLDLLFEYLKSKNSDLYKVSPLFNGDNKIFIITGILSAFTIEDIYFYCKENPRIFYGGYYLNMKYNEEYTNIMNYITKYLRINFFPSFETLNKIKNRINSLK